MPDTWIIILALASYACVMLIALIAIVGDYMTTRELRRIKYQDFHGYLPGAYDRARREGRIWGENDELID